LGLQQRSRRGKTPLTAFQPGDAVRIVNDRDKFIGYGYVNPRSLIAARILSRDEACRRGGSCS